MKKLWNAKWTPAIALIVLMLFGVMNCTSNPTSSNPAESATLEMQAEEANTGQATTDDPGLVLRTGFLRISETGECWFLMVHPSEIYELKMGEKLRGSTEDRLAHVIGYFEEENLPYCSNYPVLHVKKIILEWSPEFNTP